MLLFTKPTLSSDASSWAASAAFGNADLMIETSLDHQRHLVSVHSGDDRAAELVSPTAFRPDDEPVSSFHLPPYYRWERGSYSFRFTAEWRESPASVVMSLRHLASLRGHPRALVVERGDVSATSPVTAIVVGSPKESVDPDTAESTLRVDWRGWHVIPVEDECEGASVRVLATHTEVFIGSSKPGLDY